MISLADTFHTFAPFLPPALATPAALAEIERIAAFFPAQLASIFVLENRLAPSAEQVDLSLCIKAGEEGAGMLSAGVPPPLGADPAWARLSTFCAQWGRPGEKLAEEIGHIWLEFDGGAGDLPIPGVYFGPRFTDNRSMRVWRWENGWLADSAFMLLNGVPLSGATVTGLRCCVEGLDAIPGARIFEAGMMLSRGGEFVRLCLTGIPTAQALDYLTRIGWPGDTAIVADLLKFGTYVDTVDLYVDVGENVLPTLGLECRLDAARYGTDTEELARWTALYDALVAQGLCAPEKRDSALAWMGTSRAILKHDPRPQKLLRFLSHVKLVYAPDRPPAAKGYFSFMHLPAAPARPKTTRVSLIEALRSGIAGEVLPAGAKFARDFSRLARRNLPITVVATREEDLIHVLKVANLADMPVMVRGVGNSSGEHTLSDKGIFVTFKRPPAPEFTMAYDTRLLRVSGRTRLFDLERAINRIGWTLPALPGYLNLTLGGVLATGGGYGFRSALYSALVDNVKRVRLVLPDGTSVWCSPEENQEWFRFALGGFGGLGIIAEAELAVIPYRRWTLLAFYEHATPEAIANHIEAQVALKAPGIVRGWITPQGVFGTVFGAERPDREPSALDALIMRAGTPRKLEAFEDYPFLVHDMIAERLATTPDHFRLWADYLVGANALRKLIGFVEARRPALVPYLYNVPILAVRKGGLHLPLAMHHFGPEEVNYVLSVNCDVPASHAEGLARVQATLTEIEVEVLALGGRVTPYSYNMQDRESRRAMVGAAYVEQLTMLKAELDPKNLFNTGVY